MGEPGDMTHNPVYKDRKVGLVVFGIFQLLLGGLCALLVPIMIFGMMMGARQTGKPPSVAMMVPGILVYVVAAIGFIWMGIGSIQARRWARALVLVTSWIWLIGGGTGLIAILFLMPDMFEQMGKNGQVPASVIAVMKVVMIGFMAVIYVIIPGALVLFYGGRQVKATCEARDPRVRWTDKRPLPVLAMCLLFGFWACCLPVTGCYGWVIPFFGTMVSGLAGAGIVLVVMIAMAGVAWGAYRLDVKAWWGAVALMVAWGLSAGITFSRVGLMAFYEKMNMSVEQLEMIKQCLPSNTLMNGFIAFGIVIVLGFLLYVRRFFFRPSETACA